MKTIMSSCLAIVYATMFAACGVEPAGSDQNASATTSETSSELTSADTEPQLVQVPPELRMNLDELDDVSGNKATIDACSVTLQFCKDPKTKLPSYCSVGCTAQNAAIIAASLCIEVCGNIKCTKLTNHGHC